MNNNKQLGILGLMINVVALILVIFNSDFKIVLSFVVIGWLIIFIGFLRDIST